MRFTSRQVVVIVAVVATAAVLLPVGVQAVTGSSVNITDAVTASTKARVEGSGALRVTETDPVTREFARITGGALRVTPVQATPWNQINDIQVSGSTSRAQLFSAIGPEKLNLTSFTLAAEGPNAGTVRLFAIVYVSSSNLGNCLTLSGASFGAAERFVLTVPVGQTVNIVYPTPLVYSAYAGAGKKYCVDVEGTGPASFVAHISAVGFLT